MCCVKIAEIIITATRRRRAPPVAAPPALPLPVVIAWLIGLAIFILYLRHGLGSRRPSAHAPLVSSLQCPKKRPQPSSSASSPRPASSHDALRNRPY